MKINTMEQKLIKLLTEDNDDFRLIWTRFLDYYATKDALENSNHIDFIRTIYSKKQPHTLKHVSLSCNLHISERTLYRYRKQYLQCLELIAARLNSPLNLHNLKND